MRNFFSNLFKTKQTDEFDEVPDGVCPNCWGDQEYGNVIREKFKDAQIDVNNRERKYAFIQDFYHCQSDVVISGLEQMYVGIGY